MLGLLVFMTLLDSEIIVIDKNGINSFRTGFSLVIMYQKIIIKPILTEKMAIMQERENKYAFIVFSGMLIKFKLNLLLKISLMFQFLKVSTMNFDGKIKQNDY